MTSTSSRLSSSNPLNCVSASNVDTETPLTFATVVRTCSSVLFIEFYQQLLWHVENMVSVPMLDIYDPHFSADARESA